LNLDLRSKQTQQQGKKKNSSKNIVFPVTSPILSPYTREHYEKNINRFLAYFQIKDVEPLKEYSLQHASK
jgi:hypothetical protein